MGCAASDRFLNEIDLFQSWSKAKYYRPVRIADAHRWKFPLLRLASSFLKNAFASWPFPATVNSLILKGMYGHPTRR